MLIRVKAMPTPFSFLYSKLYHGSGMKAIDLVVFHLSESYYTVLEWSSHDTA